MEQSLFAGLPVTDFPQALGWYEQLWGAPPTFMAHATEAVWELADERFVYVVLHPEHAGHALVTLFVDDLASRLEAIAARGLEPAERETYDNGVHKAVFRDPDGNEIGFGGAG